MISTLWFSVPSILKYTSQVAVHSLLRAMDGTCYSCVSETYQTLKKYSTIWAHFQLYKQRDLAWLLFLRVLNLQIIRLPKLCISCSEYLLVWISSSSSNLCPHGSISVRATWLMFQPEPLHVCEVLCMFPNTYSIMLYNLHTQRLYHLPTKI